MLRCVPRPAPGSARARGVPTGRTPAVVGRSSTIDLSDEDKQIYVNVRIRLGSLLRAYQAVVPDALDAAADESRFALARRDEVFDGYQQAGLLLYSTEDHLRTIDVILRAKLLPPLAMYSLLRPAGEAIARSRHLLDSKIDEQNRLARGLTERLINLQEQDKVLPDKPFLAKRTTFLVEKAGANGIQPVHDRHGVVIAFGTRRPSLLKAFEECFDEGATIYRVLSAHVHSMPWSTLHSGETLPAEPGFATKTISVPFFGNILAELLARHEENILRLLDAAGHPASAWAESMQSSVTDVQGELRRELLEGRAG